MRTLLALLAGAAALSGAALYATRDAPAAIPADVPFSEERITLPKVELVDQHGTRHRLDELGRDTLLVITFGYTSCETICPLGNAIMAVVEDEAPEALSRQVRLISITIDPLTDRPEVLAGAAAAFDAGPNWFWLTGRAADIDRVLSGLDATAADIVFHDPVFLVGAADEGRFFRSLSMPAPDEIIAMLGAIAG